MCNAPAVAHVVQIGALCLVLAAAAPAAELAFVTSARDGSVTAIDLASHVEAGRIEQQIGWHDVAVSPDGRTAYVPDRAGRRLSVIDLEAFRVADRIPVGDEPDGVALSPDGRTAYVVGFPAVAVDLASRTVTAVHPSDAIGSMRVAPDGGTLYATSPQGILVTDRHTGTTRRILDGLHAGAAVLSRDGERLYAIGVFRLEATVHLLTVATADDLILNDVVLGLSDVVDVDHLVVRGDGRRAYVAGKGLRRRSVIAVDPESGAIVDEIEVGVEPFALALSPDDARLYATGWRERILAVADLHGVREVQSIALPSRPVGVFVPPDGTVLYVAGDAGFHRLDAATASLTGTIPAGAGSGDIAVSHDAEVAFVANVASRSVGIIDLAAGRMVGSIPLAEDPAALALTPDGARVYVAAGRRLYAIDTAARTVAAELALAAPADAIAISADGGLAAVSGRLSQQIALVDIPAGRILGEGAAGPLPWGVAFLPTGVILVAGEGAPGLRYLRAMIPPTVLATARLALGSQPCSLAIDREGTVAFLGERLGRVTAVDVVQRLPLRKVATGGIFGGTVCDLALSHGGRRLYAVNPEHDLVTELDTAPLRVLRQIPVPPQPRGVAVACVGACPPADSPTPTRTSLPSPCVGDCDSDGGVSVGDLVRGVAIAVGAASVATCRAADADANGMVNIDEIITAIATALTECPGGVP